MTGTALILFLCLHFVDSFCVDKIEKCVAVFDSAKEAGHYCKNIPNRKIQRTMDAVAPWDSKIQPHGQITYEVNEREECAENKFRIGFSDDEKSLICAKKLEGEKE